MIGRFVILLLLAPFALSPVRAQDPVWVPTGDFKVRGNVSVIAIDGVQEEGLLSTGRELVRVDLITLEKEFLSIPADSVVALAITSYGTYLASVVRQGSDSTGHAAATGALLRSDDRGVTWEEAGAGSPSSVCRELHSLYADGIYAVCNPGDLLYSEDDGETWYPVSPMHVETLVTNGFGLLAAYNGTQRAVATSSTTSWTYSPSMGPHATLATAAFTDYGLLLESWLIAGGGGLLRRSADRGLTWEDISQQDRAHVFRFLVTVSNGEMLGIAESGRLFGSGDEGLTWYAMPDSLRGVLSLNVASGGLVLAGTSHGAYVSDSHGYSWNTPAPVFAPTIHALIPLSSGGVLAGAEAGGVRWCTGTCDTWSPIGLENQTIVDLLETSDGSIVAATNEGVFVSADMESWRQGAFLTEDGSGLFMTVPVLSVAEDASGALYAATSNNIHATGKVYRSTDAGETWQPTAFPHSFLPIDAFDLALANDGAIVAGGPNGLYRFDTGSSSWAEISGLPNTASDILDHPRDGLLIAGAEEGASGVFRPGMEEPVALADTAVYQLVLGSDGAIYAATEYGVLRSIDDGASWQEFGDVESAIGADRSVPVRALAIDDAGRLVAGTVGHGVLLTAEDVGSDDSELPEARFALLPPYPNPFSSSTTLRLEVPETQHVSIRVFDVLGRLVATLHDGVLTAGHVHVFTLEAGGRPSGAYLVDVRGAGFRTSRTVVLVR